MGDLARVSLLAGSVAVAVLLQASVLAEETPEAFRKIAANGYCPSWSPDGSRIVYGSTGDDAYEVWIVRLADGETTRLTTGGGFHPAVSPDGKHVTFDDRGAHGRIHRMTITGGEPVRLTPQSMEGNFSNHSPDGATIIFEAGGDIWSMPSEGGEASRVISREVHETRPVYSPDGKKIAFDAADGGRSGNRDIWVYDTVGKSFSRLTNDPGKEIQPHWSPDGTMIAYMAERSGNREIWIMKADGSAAVQVTFQKGSDVWPRWAPDGRRLAFGSDRSGSMDIWIVDLEKQLGKGFLKEGGQRPGAGRFRTGRSQDRTERRPRLRPTLCICCR